MSRRGTLIHLLEQHVSADEREEADRARCCGSRTSSATRSRATSRRAHFTASAFVVDEGCARTCLVQHVKLERLLQPGGHVEPSDISLEAAALREAHEETTPRRRACTRTRRGRSTSTSTRSRSGPDEPAHFHLDVRYLVVGSGDPCDGAAWYAIGEAGDGSVRRLAAKALSFGSPAGGVSSSGLAGRPATGSVAL